MALGAKQKEDANRLRYIRVIERFIRSVVGYLVKEEKADFEGFCARVAKQKTFLDQVEPAVLYKAEYTKREQFVKTLLDATKEVPEDFSTLKSSLCYTSNQIHKNKNNMKYKKDKHTKHKYVDGY